MFRFKLGIVSLKTCIVSHVILAYLIAEERVSRRKVTDLYSKLKVDYKGLVTTERKGSMYIYMQFF